MRAAARSAGVGDGAETASCDSASPVPGGVVSMQIQAYCNPPSAPGRAAEASTTIAVRCMSVLLPWPGVMRQPAGELAQSTTYKKGLSLHGDPCALTM